MPLSWFGGTCFPRSHAPGVEGEEGPLVMASRVTLESSPSVQSSWMLSNTEIPCALYGCAASEPKEMPCTGCPALERMNARASKGKSSSRIGTLRGFLCVVLFSGSKMAQKRKDNKRDIEGRSCAYVLLHVYVQMLMHVCVGVHAYLRACQFIAPKVSRRLEAHRGGQAG